MTQEHENEEWPFEQFQGNSPADGQVIRDVELELGVSLPDDYRCLLQKMDGGEGFVDHTFIRLWPAGELLTFN
jgi:cell wall assembly regulator SMI1